MKGTEVNRAEKGEDHARMGILEKGNVYKSIEAKSTMHSGKCKSSGMTGEQRKNTEEAGNEVKRKVGLGRYIKKNA